METHMNKVKLFFLQIFFFFKILFERYFVFEKIEYVDNAKCFGFFFGKSNTLYAIEFSLWKKGFQLSHKRKTIDTLAIK